MVLCLISVRPQLKKNKKKHFKIFSCENTLCTSGSS